MKINDNVKKEIYDFYKNHRFCNNINKYIKKESQTDLYIQQQLKLYPWFQTKRKFISCFVKGIYKPVLCKQCNKLVKLDNVLEGKKFCSAKCAQINKATREKCKKTNLNKLGVEFPAQSEQIREKCKKTMKQNYGVDYPLQSIQLKNKLKLTCLNKYNVEHYSQTKEGKQRIIKQQHQKGYDVILNKWKDYVIPLFDIENYHGLQQKNLHTIYKWKCVKCGNEFEQASHSSGLHQCEIGSSYLPVCPICYPINKSMSNIEKEIVDFIKSIYEGEILTNNRQLISRYELDIVIIDKKLAIEFNGLYWHNDSKIKDKNYHLMKTKLCESKGYRLIHIFEDEWNDKQQIIKKLIKSALGFYDKVINAYDCELKDIEDIDDFLEENYLGDKFDYDKSYGLYYKDELISIIMINKANVMRIVSNMSYDIENIITRIREVFLSKFDGNLKLETDRRYESKENYKDLKLIEEKYPDFYWIKNHCRISRFEFDKNDKIFINSYNKIYDCGKLIYIMESNK